MSQLSLKSACRGKTTKLLGNLAGSGCQFESSSNPERRLHPPLSDPAELGKVTEYHEPLCKPSQEPVPASTCDQNCSTNCFLGCPAKQLLETYPRSEQTKSFLKAEKFKMETPEIIRTRRGVGYLNRLQGHLLPYTNTGTIQGIYEISHPSLDIPVQGCAIRFVHSTHGVHCDSKRGESDGHTQGYSNPPKPRRLVGDSQVPPKLSPAYTGSSKNVSTTGLAGEFRKIRGGAQTGLRL